MKTRIAAAMATIGFLMAVTTPAQSVVYWNGR